MKCPYCGTETIGKIQPSGGTSYVLTEVDTSKTPANFLATQGLPVEVLACTNCKGIILTCPSLK